MFKFGENKSLQLFNILKDKKTGLLYRENSSDEITLKDVKSEYKKLYPFCKDKTILDMGANIGIFTHYALENGAKKVICYEPEEINYSILLNQNFKQVELHNVAITQSDSFIMLYSTPIKEGKKISTDNHSIKQIRGRTAKQVESLNFRKQLDLHQPDILKVDIEGAEFILDFKNLPECIKYIAIEIHYQLDEICSDKLLEVLRDQFNELDFKMKNMFKKKFAAVFIGERK